MQYVVVNAVTTRVSRAHRIIGELFRLFDVYIKFDIRQAKSAKEFGAGSVFCLNQKYLYCLYGKNGCVTTFITSVCDKNCRETTIEAIHSY